MIDLGVSGVSLPLWFVHYGNQAVCSFIPVMSVHCSKNRPHWVLLQSGRHRTTGRRLPFLYTHTHSLSPQPLGRCTINPLTHEFSHFYELCREETTEQQCHCQMWNRTAKESKWDRKRAWDTRPKRTKVILHCNVPGRTHTWTHKSVHRVSIHGHLHLMFLFDAASRCRSWLPIKE